MKTIATAIAAIAMTSTAAFAHVTFATPEASQGSTYIGVLNIGHGCEGEPTRRVRVQIPEGVIAVKPVPKAGWDLEIVTGTYATTYDYYGTPLNEGPVELIWTGELDDAHFDQFAFRGKLTDSLKAGTTVYFPVIQECANGSHNWVNIPAEGQDSHDLAEPAPALNIIEADHHAHH
ncbi:YcnI family protein [Celeribacter sp.]|uniref:YcnI family copper-binding membrane protein n=1 Tax=Celeribacter sp. TaxID=1890673 RepID=UPI003A8E9894